jgi:hypothetical protein
MLDRLIALVALAALGVFLAVPVLKLRELDLTIVIVACFLLAAVDFGFALFRRSGARKRREGGPTAT